MTLRKRDLPTLVALLLAGTMLGTAAFADRGGPGGMGGMFMQMPAFEEVDANGDGKITPEEIDAHRTARAAALDANGDGGISLEELTAAEAAKAAERAQRMMAARDADGDGVLTAAEMMLPPAPDRMFERLDSDGDGALSREEIEAARARMAESRGDRKGRHGRHWPMFGGQDAP